MKIKDGCTRRVFVFRKYVIKIPQIIYGWRLFLTGLLCNMQEAAFGKISDYRVCPVIWASWGGWVIIMPRCEPLTDEQFSRLDCRIYWNEENDWDDFIRDDSLCKIPVEWKKCSFGWYEDRIVAIDFGS